MRFLLAVMASAVALTSAHPGQAQDNLGTLFPKDLVGTYKIVSGENSGESAPKERIEGVMVRFTETAVVVADATNNHVYAASYELRSSENPAKISMVSTLDHNKGSKASGLIQKDGDTVKLIYKLPEGEEPTKFETQKGQLMFVMRRVPD